MGIGWLVFLLMVFWASKHGSTGEAKFFDPYEILQVLLPSSQLALYIITISSRSCGFCASAMQHDTHNFAPCACVLLSNTEMILMLQVERGATEKDVKRAYRQLSKQYHPDKNPDPAAAVYFAESISKAYKALTGQPDRPA